jgi:uncharacterized protein YukE
MPIHIDPEELEAQASEINTWGEEIKSFVTESVTRRQAAVEGMTMDGQAAMAFKGKFAEMGGQINAQIESITDGQIAAIRQKLIEIGNSMTDVDQSLANY